MHQIIYVEPLEEKNLYVFIASQDSPQIFLIKEENLAMIQASSGPNQIQDDSDQDDDDDDDYDGDDGDDDYPDDQVGFFH